MSTTIYVLSRNKKNNAYPCKPQFYYIKVGFKGVKIIYAYFRDALGYDNHLTSVLQRLNGKPSC